MIINLFYVFFYLIALTHFLSLFSVVLTQLSVHMSCYVTTTRTPLAKLLPHGVVGVWHTYPDSVEYTHTLQLNFITTLFNIIISPMIQ